MKIEKTGLHIFGSASIFLKQFLNVGTEKAFKSRFGVLSLYTSVKLL